MATAVFMVPCFGARRSYSLAFLFEFYNRRLEECAFSSKPNTRLYTE